MKFFKVSLTAGQGAPIGATGSYFRILSGGGDVQVTFNYDGGNYHTTDWKVGIGATLKTRFTSLMIVSPTTQIIEIGYGDGTIDDSRLTGDVDINGLLSVVNAGGSTYSEKITALTSGAAVEVVSINALRSVGTFSANADGMLWRDNTVSETKGLPYQAGNLYEIKNTAALWFHPLDNGTAHLLEDIL